MEKLARNSISYHDFSRVIVVAKMWDGYHGSGSRAFLSRQGAADSRSRASSATAGCKGSEDDSEREREEEGGEDRGEAAWVEAMACGGRQKGMLLSFVSRAYFGAPSLFASSRSVLRRRREREGKDRIVATYEDAKDGERNSEGNGRRRSLRLPKETREVWMVFEECHVIIGPPFERPFQREAAPPLGSARLGSARSFRSVPLGRRVSLN